jgi:uncharacterized protein YbjT (DUF2867 family)
VLGGSSDPSSVTIDGVRATALSWDDPSGWPAATDGVDAVYVVRPDRPDAPELVAGLVAGTPAAAHVVLLSGQKPPRRPPDPWALRVEQAVRDSGRTWTLLRPGWFMQVFTDARFFRDEIVAGRLPFSSGGASVAWIDTRDIASVAERALLEPGHAGRTYELSGPQAVTLPQTAQGLSRALGRPVAHVEARDRRGRGRPGWVRPAPVGEDVRAPARRRLRRGHRHRRTGDRTPGPLTADVPGRLLAGHRPAGGDAASLTGRGARS